MPSTSLDQLSGGRVILGGGVGNVREEFEVLGIPWEKRGALTDESIDVMRSVWTQDAAQHDRPRWRFSDVHTAPKPFAGRHIPLWIGAMSEVALQRVVRAGDSWHRTGITPDEQRSHVMSLRAAATAAGRDAQALDVCMRFNIALDDVDVTEVELRWTVKGYDTARIAEVASAFASAGVTHFIYALNSHEPDVLDETVDALARDLLPRFAAG